MTEQKRNEQNMKIISLLKIAMQVTHWLIEQNYTIKQVGYGGYPVKPVIWIEPCQHCEKLGGSSVSMEPSRNGFLHTYQKLFSNCLIKWQAIEPKP